MSEPCRGLHRTDESWVWARVLEPFRAGRRKSRRFEMRTLVTVCFAVVGLGVGVPGCVAKHASAIEESDSTAPLQTASADPDDPFGSCELDDTQTEGPFPGSCSVDGSVCDGWSDVGCVDGDELCPYGRFWVWCAHECETATDCPVPSTGDAQPRCAGNNLCQLPCDDSTTCPDGFTCSDPSVIGGYSSLIPNGVCVQHYELKSFKVPENSFGD